MSRRGRRLSEAERALWDRIAAQTTPLEPKGGPPEPAAPAAPSTAPEPRASELPPDPIAALAEAAGRSLRPRGPSRAPETGFVPGEARPRPVGRPEAGLDRRTAERVRRGERAPDARVDLHGMSADRAHRALDRFVGRAAAEGHRLLLVITGKGGSPRRTGDAPWMAPERGVLREAAPLWLRSGPQRHRILGIYEAHARHGGGGAFYVYLKKPR